MTEYILAADEREAISKLFNDQSKVIKTMHGTVTFPDTIQLEAAFKEGYQAALKTTDTLQKGQYWKDWINSATKKQKDEEAKKNTTSYIPRGCISTKYCNNCNTEFSSSICVCMQWQCSYCGETLSPKMEGKIYRVEYNGKLKE